ncbi:hypothetical protein ZIOFF_048880 [Zingiber officinale]|uniref:MULE transposase domain-containing protein n=1 Tax=Zingiber officinale TaxID=94328 RepID=A0A8J5KSY3_ZINOF|nr:hypothetical protein ZIOFF_048880 [Zingiber officinale]
MLHLYRFAEELGFEEIERPRFWHKLRHNSSNGRYPENDVDVLTINDNISTNHQVEIYIAYECDDESDETCLEMKGSGTTDGDDYEEEEEFHDSYYEFEKDDKIFDSRIDHDMRMFNEMVMVDHQVIDFWVDIYVEMEEISQSSIQQEALLPTEHTSMVALLINFMGSMSHVGSSNGSDELNYVPSLIFEPRIQMTAGENINMGPPLPSQDFVELLHVESPRYYTMIPFPLPLEVQLDNEARSSEYFHSQSSEDGGDILSIPMDDDSPDDGDCDTHLNRGEIPPYNKRVMHFINDIGEENDDDNVDREDNVHIDIWSESKNQIRLGMLFDNKSQLRNAVTLCSISQNQEFKIVENRINTWVAKCKVVSSDIDSNSGPENFRPVISVDGTHLRGAYKGKMLIVVSKDANNRILPIAYAIVDEETIASWSWFFEQFSGRANTNWIETHQQYIDHWRDSLNHVENGELVNDPIHASIEYMSWYWQRTVIYITNLSQRFSSNGFQGDGEATEYLMDGMCRVFYTSLALIAISDAKHAGYFAQIRDIASHYMHQARGQQCLDIRHLHVLEQFGHQSSLTQKIHREHRNVQWGRQGECETDQVSHFANVKHIQRCPLSTMGKKKKGLKYSPLSQACELKFASYEEQHFSHIEVVNLAANDFHEVDKEYEVDSPIGEVAQSVKDAFADHVSNTKSGAEVEEQGSKVKEVAGETTNVKEAVSAEGVMSDPIPVARDSDNQKDGLPEVVPPTQPAQEVQKKKTWASLFRNNRKSASGVSLEQYKAKGERLSIDFDDIDGIEDALGFCLVGCFMGQHAGRNGVYVIANQWKVHYKFFIHKSGWVVYRFDTKEDRDRVLQGGPLLLEFPFF